jgi:hypothetical protein
MASPHPGPLPGGEGDDEDKERRTEENRGWKMEDGENARAGWETCSTGRRPADGDVRSAIRRIRIQRRKVRLCLARPSVDADFPVVMLPAHVFGDEPCFVQAVTILTGCDLAVRSDSNYGIGEWGHDALRVSSW